MECVEDSLKGLSRREFLELLTSGFLAWPCVAALTGCSGRPGKAGDVPSEVVRRKNALGNEVSLLGFGMMRLPTVQGRSARDFGGEIDQEALNGMLDYALAHGVNYFDTSPRCCGALS